MNYEQKYKELVEKLHTAKKKSGGYTFTSVIDAILPELKESEDESIRKDLIELVKETHTSKRYYDLNKILAWLEKQGEQKPTTGKSYIEIFPKFSVGDTLCRQGWSNHTVRKVYVDNITTTYVCENEEGLESHIDISEQDEWNKIEQKPDWSEEDEKLYNSALWHIKNSCGNGGKNSGEYEVYNWLKSIKDRVQPQPKQEWSEKDEKFVVDTMNFLHRAKNQYARTARLEECIDWLESLKPNNWRPSKDQMFALRMHIQENPNLESLYNYLKEL